MPYHVRGHAGKRKPHKDSNGLLGKHWTKDDWGNWTADRVAAQDHDILTRHGVQIVQLNISASELYSSLPSSGQWYIGDCTGSPVGPNGVGAHLQHRLWKTYLAERDEFRRKRQADPKWVLDSSMQHSAAVFNLEQASLSLTSTRVRIIYDKGFHGGNRAKNDKLSLVDRLKTRACILCRTPDSQDHWLHYCSHSTLANLRTSIVTELNVTLTKHSASSSGCGV